MKYVLILLFILAGCSKKYQTYQVIKKSSFNYPGENNPVSKKLIPGRKETQENCEGQWLFMRNAQKINEANVRSMVNFSCPKDNYLVNSKITEIWWTTLIYSRSCIELETYCPR
jgi:hypothetical protein